MSEESSSSRGFTGKPSGAVSPSGQVFQSVDLRSASSSMENLFEQVVRRIRRVEITRQGGESCVLISKAELEGLEQALEILAATDSGVAMRDTVLRAAAATVTRSVAVAAGTV